MMPIATVCDFSGPMQPDLPRKHSLTVPGYEEASALSFASLGWHWLCQWLFGRGRKFSNAESAVPGANGFTRPLCESELSREGFGASCDVLASMRRTLAQPVPHQKRGNFETCAPGSMRNAWLAALMVVASTAMSQSLLGQDTYTTATAAAADPDFPIQGEYAAPGIGLQVVAVGEGTFDFAVYAGGLPGAGWDRTPPQRADGDADTIRSLVASRNLQRLERQSPTLGAPPPSGAVVLFDGSPATLEQWQAGAQRTDDGLLVAGATTRGEFRDYTLHVEFQTPYQPTASGQARGNSGVYHQGRYETQILDSFGLEGKNNEAGGIYEVRDPDLNMCLPPLSWQTYDIDFTAARFDAAGNKIADAQLTVRLNGVVVQRDVRVAHPTRAAPLPETSEPGPIHLQDHGNPVRFRNIWLVPRDADRESMRPKVVGFERFFAAAAGSGDSEMAEVLGGRLLISQLGCAACHATTDEQLKAKAAPLLSHVGSRVRLDHLVAFVGRPHEAKPGSTMPDLFHHLSSDQRAQRAAELASWLATTGQPLDRPGDTAAAQRGETTFHTIGCVACHAPRRGEPIADATSVPLGNLTAKYTLDSLSQFLANPHAVRASGAMPKLVGSLTEARDLACYLLGDAIIAPGAEQFDVKVYHGSWSTMPDFDKVQPVKTGTARGLDLSLGGRSDQFGLRFEAYLPVPVDGQYKFYLGSDDGSRLWIDDEEVIAFDGVHPFSFREGRKELKAGMHRIRLDYFENAGQEQLELEVEGPGQGRSPAALLVTSSSEAITPKPLIATKFRPVATLAKAGRETFTRSGCANCHSLVIGEETLRSTLQAPALATLQGQAGCLAQRVPDGLPDYALSPVQRRAIETALAHLRDAKPLSDAQQVHVTLAGKNCYACHSRNAVGGPEPSRDPLFTTRMQEMGNEARVPPPLTGVGDKLKPEVIDRIVADGAKDRPYMLTRMPGFGNGNLEGLRERLVNLDQHAAHQGHTHDAGQLQELPEEERVAAGRKLVGGSGLACIKCHTFGGKSTPGIQAIDMATMPERLREDWFHRYMLAPSEYRPGTRMPLSFPEGKSVLENVLGGHADAQIDAMWLYLSQGSSVKPPTGLDAEAIVLASEARPVIYRNFIEGLSPRGIAVGYPERINLAWDAGNMSLALLWKNDFIDAAKHWVGRGPGFQGPLGDFVIQVDKAVPVARLESIESPWPTAKPRELGYRFRGYSLDEAGRPKFRYSFDGVQVEDFVLPSRATESLAQPAPLGRSTLQRHTTVTVAKPTEGLFYRAATGQIREEGNGVFTVDSRWNLHIASDKSQIVAIGGVQELRVALPPTGSTTITTTISW